MIKKCLASYITALILLTMPLFVCINIAESDAAQVADRLSNKSLSASITVPNDSVLRIIPEKTLGLIYCPNLLELDNRIRRLLIELSLLTELSYTLPTEASDIPTKILLNILETQFEILSELEEMELDLHQDFAILLTSLKPLHLSVLVHLTDPEATKEIIKAVTKEDALTRYKDVTYWNDKEDGENFAILGNILVFSKQPKGCEDVIDTYNGTIQSITENPDYIFHLTNILEDADQLAVYFEIENAMATLNRPLEEEFESMIANLEDENRDKNPILEMIAPVLKGMSGADIAFIEQVQSVNARLQVEGTDVQIKPFLKFTSDSEYLEMLQEGSDELAFLGELPSRAFMNAAFQRSPKLLSELSEVWFDFIPTNTPEERAQREALLEEVKPFHESLANRWSISLNNLGDPSTLVFTYELKDEEKSRAYMDEIFSERLKDIRAYQGKRIMHNGVEIKSYIFPNFKMLRVEDLPEVTDSTSSAQRWYYAFTEGQLIFSMGSGPESIQMALDRKAGSEEKFFDHPSYQKLVEKLGTDNNIFLAISPIIAAKTGLPRMAKNDPNNAAALQLLSGMLMALPENYSVGITVKAKNNGIDANLLINLGDFKQLTQALGMMFQ